MLDCETNRYLRQENTTNLTKHVWTLKESLLAIHECCLLRVVKDKKQPTYLLWCHLVKVFGHLCFVNSARVKIRSTNYPIQILCQNQPKKTPSKMLFQSTNPHHISPIMFPAYFKQTLGTPCLHPVQRHQESSPLTRHSRLLPHDMVGWLWLWLWMDGC